MFFSCSSTNNNSKNYEIKPLHNELDWQGTYSGTEHCKICKIINKTLTLNSDKTFAVTLEYVAANSQKMESFEGEFEWGEEDRILLNTESGEDMGIKEYIIAHDILIPFSESSGPLLGKNSMLRKEITYKIYNTEWVLTELYGNKLIVSDDEEIQKTYINFLKNGTVDGSTGCNLFNSEFVMEFHEIESSKKIVLKIKQKLYF